tara:strand:+ start:1226 stop:1648 length:423 start_codon:yes stop_codon:yes gene_type:complete
MNFLIQYNEFCLNYLKSIKKIASSLSLTQSQILCIKSIPFDGISQVNLSKKLALDLSTLSRNLEKLKKDKIINKAKSNYDNRSSIITLTKKGKTIYKEIISVMQSEINNILLKINIDDIDYLTEVLNKINWEIELNNNYE